MHPILQEFDIFGLLDEPFALHTYGLLIASGFLLGMTVAKRAGIPNHKSADPEVAAALRALSTDDLLGLIDFRDRYTPVVDGEFLPAHVSRLISEGKQHPVPYITGTVSWEASLGRSIGGPFSPENLSRIISDEVKAELYPGLTGAVLEDWRVGVNRIEAVAAGKR